MISVKAAGVLRLLTLAGYIGTLTATLPNNMMLGLGRMRQFTTYTTIRAAVLAIFCFIFIRPLGIEGAGWALLSTCSIDIVYLGVVLHDYIHIGRMQLFRQAYLKPILLGIVFIGLSFLMRPLATTWLGFGLVGSILGIIYIIAGFVIGIFGETEKRAIAGLWKMSVNLFRNERIL